MHAKTSLAVSSLALAALLALGAGCGDSTESSVTRDTNTEAVEEVAAKVYAVGDMVETGPITHKVVSVEKMDTIPASATLPEWEIIAEDTPADEGFTWLHIKGEVTNNSKEKQNLSSQGVYVVDATGNEFEVSTDTTIYVEDDLSPVYLDIQPTQTVNWEGYFEVPSDTAGLTLMVNDLALLPKTEASVDLGL